MCFLVIALKILWILVPSKIPDESVNRKLIRKKIAAHRRNKLFPPLRNFSSSRTNDWSIPFCEDRNFREEYELAIL